MKLRMPTKLGFKNPKHIAAIFVTNDIPRRLLGRQGLQLVQRLLSKPSTPSASTAGCSSIGQ